jgi:energy-coupling factor transporter ATP-binding protein EcfA2
MVTHDLRMCQFVDRVIQMKDGKLIRVIEEPEQIRAFAGGAQHEPEATMTPARQVPAHAQPAAAAA